MRLAASLAIDRKAINEAEALGFSGLTGNIVPRHMEFALPIEPHPYDPKRFKQLLTEAGYPTGFDAGDITPNPPYFSMAEAIGTNLGAVGIKVQLGGSWRHLALTAWGDKKLKGIVLGAQGAGGNAATRIEGVATRNGTYAYGVLPEVEDLFLRQARELDRPSDAKRCSTRSSASSTSAWSSRPSGRTASSAGWVRGRRSRP